MIGGVLMGVINDIRRRTEIIGYLHVQIRFPWFLDITHVVAQKNDVIRTKRVAAQRHSGFSRSAVTFLVVALVACSDQIFPGIFAVSAPGQNMVDGQVAACSAVLTLIPVPFHDVFSGENDVFKWDASIFAQTNH